METNRANVAFVLRGQMGRWLRANTKRFGMAIRVPSKRLCCLGWHLTNLFRTASFWNLRNAHPGVTHGRSTCPRSVRELVVFRRNICKIWKV